MGSVIGHNLSQQERGGAATTPTLHYSVATNSEIKPFVVANHYSHRFPSGTDHAFKIERNGILVGVATFGAGSGNRFGVVALKEIPEPSLYRELTRLVLLDSEPRNSESRFVAWCLRWLEKNTDLIAVTSFADPDQGHKGIIYRAGNWILIGKPIAHCVKLFIDDTEVHPRTANARYGTSKTSELLALGLQVRTEKRQFKYKFAYPLRDWVRPELAKIALIE